MDMVNLEILKCDFLLCIMNTPRFVVSNLMEEFISIYKGLSSKTTKTACVWLTTQNQICQDFADQVLNSVIC